ncbi:hypothetical protein BGZ94_006174, partial [Podila epigama]
DVIETICAIMLLDDVTTKDMFQLLLAQRRAAILHVLDPKDTQGISQQIVQAIQILRATFFHVDRVFKGQQGAGASFSRLEMHLKSLQQTFAPPALRSTASPSLNTTLKQDEVASSVSLVSPLQPSALLMPTSVIPKLYPTTPNIHLLVRYLPESIQNFTPFIHLDGPRATFTQEQLCHGIQQWKDDMIRVISAAVEKLLEQVHSSTELVAIRSKVWQELQADEFAIATRSTNSSWTQ